MQTSSRPDPGLPDFVGAVSLLELLLAVLRVGLGYWVWTGVEGIGLSPGATYIVKMILFASSLLALGSLIGALGILLHFRTAPLLLAGLVLPVSLCVVVSLGVAVYASATGVRLDGLVWPNV